MSTFFGYMAAWALVYTIHETLCHAGQKVLASIVIGMFVGYLIGHISFP
jgi:hypothetical protein